MATIEQLKEHQAELKEKFGQSTCIAYANVSMTQLSIARHYGGCKVQGHHFVYNWMDDSLIREDVVKWLADKEKAAAKESKKPAKPKAGKQKDLF